MVTIEAALAYKSKDSKTQQPQRPRRPRPAPTPQQPEANQVSRDENQAPVEPKPPKPPEPARQEEDFAEQFEKYRQMRHEDESAEAEDGPGTDVDRAGGAFDGSEHGFAEVNKGDPYMRELAGQAHGFWSVPTLEQGSGHAMGCVQLGKDGRILDTQLRQPSGNATIDAAVKRALKQLTELRETKATPVPAHLMVETTRPTCFEFPY
jgi:outer membrane biosynthesis protein TonB